MNSPYIVHGSKMEIYIWKNKDQNIHSEIHNIHHGLLSYCRPASVDEMSKNINTGLGKASGKL